MARQPALEGAERLRRGVGWRVVQVLGVGDATLAVRSVHVDHRRARPSELPVLRMVHADHGDRARGAADRRIPHEARGARRCRDVGADHVVGAVLRPRRRVVVVVPVDDRGPRHAVGFRCRSASGGRRRVACRRSRRSSGTDVAGRRHDGDRGRRARRRQVGVVRRQAGRPARQRCGFRRRRRWAREALGAQVRLVQPDVGGPDDRLRRRAHPVDQAGAGCTRRRDRARGSGPGRVRHPHVRLRARRRHRATDLHGVERSAVGRARARCAGDRSGCAPGARRRAQPTERPWSVARSCRAPFRGSPRRC